ncbi:MAG: hypothetical protein VB957_00360 [Pseudomonadales bacterium]
MLTIIGFSALIGCIVYLIVSIEYAFILRKNGILLLPAFLFSAIWALSTSHIYTFDFIYTAFWSGVFLAVFHSNKQLAAFTLRWAFLWAVPFLSLSGAIYTAVNANQPTQSHF